MQNWIDLYKELSQRLLEEVPKLKWVDLWHNQISFMETEHLFSSPALFLAFRSHNIQDLGEKVQSLTIELDCYLFYETFADTYRGSFNQEGALVYLNLMQEIYACLHGSDGENYSSMRRVGFAPVDTGSAGNLYQIVFQCLLNDFSAQKAYDKTHVNEVELNPYRIPRS